MLLTFGFFGLGLSGWATYSGLASEDLPPVILSAGGRAEWGGECYSVSVGANFTRVAVEGASATLREIYLSGGPAFQRGSLAWSLRLGVNSLGLASKETEAIQSPNYPGIKGEAVLERVLKPWLRGRLCLAASVFPTREGLYPMAFLGAELFIRKTP